LIHGAALSNDPPRERQAIQQICSALSLRGAGEDLAPVYGHILAHLQKLGKSIATIDLLIAAAALLDEAPVITRNLRHFQRVPGLEVRTY